MNRRLFLKMCSGIGAVIVSGSTWFSLLNHLWKTEVFLYHDIQESVKSLHHRYFAKAFPDLSLNDVLYELIRRGVYKNDGFDIHQIRLNARSDRLVEFENFLYTESELLLYAMVARLSLLHVWVTLIPVRIATHE